MTNVVNISTHPARLRRGELAIHSEYGWVEIVARTGAERKVRWIQCSPSTPNVVSPEERDSESVAFCEDWVDADSLIVAPGRIQGLTSRLIRMPSPKREAPI
jgi:hypothetical protein